MSRKVAKHLSNDYADPNLHTDSLRKDLLLLLQTARGLGLDTEGLDGMAAVLEGVTAAAGLHELHRLTAFRT